MTLVRAQMVSIVIRAGDSDLDVSPSPQCFLSPSLTRTPSPSSHPTIKPEENTSAVTPVPRMWLLAFDFTVRDDTGFHSRTQLPALKYFKTPFATAGAFHSRLQSCILKLRIDQGVHA